MKNSSQSTNMNPQNCAPTNPKATTKIGTHVPKRPEETREQQMVENLMHELNKSASRAKKVMRRREKDGSSHKKADPFN